MATTRTCPVCGKEFRFKVGNQIYCSAKCRHRQEWLVKSQQKAHKKPNPNQSLCWTCARAYALPDPAGCAFHRRTASGEIEGFPYLLAKESQRYYKVGEWITVYTVQKCADYATGRARNELADGEKAELSAGLLAAEG